MGVVGRDEDHRTDTRENDIRISAGQRFATNFDVIGFVGRIGVVAAVGGEQIRAYDLPGQPLTTVGRLANVCSEVQKAQIRGPSHLGIAVKVARELGQDHDDAFFAALAGKTRRLPTRGGRRRLEPRVLLGRLGWRAASEQHRKSKE